MSKFSRIFTIDNIQNTVVFVILFIMVGSVAMESRRRIKNRHDVHDQINEDKLHPFSETQFDIENNLKASRSRSKDKHKEKIKEKDDYYSETSSMLYDDYKSDEISYAKEKKAEKKDEKKEPKDKDKEKEKESDEESNDEKKEDKPKKKKKKWWKRKKSSLLPIEKSYAVDNKKQNSRESKSKVKAIDREAHKHKKNSKNSAMLIEDSYDRHNRDKAYDYNMDSSRSSKIDEVEDSVVAEN